MSRYIDADKHLQKLGERRDMAIIWELKCNDEATKDRAQEAILIFNECMLELINAPTADVRDDATAHKVVGGGERDGATCWFECDNCGLAVDIGDVFCKHCGARFVP